MRRDYDFGTQLGRGSFGVVYKVRRKADARTYVCKQILLQSMNKKAREEANLEVTLMRKVSSGSEYIVQYVESFLECDSLHIIMEFCEHGDLNRHLKAQAGMNIEENTLWKFLIQIGLGLRWLHYNRILHRDIKTLNVFLTSAHDVRLGDLGVARVLSHNTNFASTFVGTPYYLSPELCEEKPYNEKSDVWAYGCVIYEMCSLTHPFDARNHAALLIKILRGQYAPVPAMYSTELRNLIDDCMRREYTQRPTLSELLAGSAVVAWADRLGISLALPGEAAPGGAAPGSVREDPNAKPSRQRPVVNLKASPPHRKVARARTDGRLIPKASGGPPLARARAGRSEPNLGGARARGRCGQPVQRRGSEEPVRTQVICAPASTSAAAQVIRAPMRGRPPPEQPAPTPAHGAGARKKSNPAEARQRAVAVREVADLPDVVVPNPVVRRNVPSVRQLLAMEAGNYSEETQPSAEPAAPSLESTLSSEGAGFAANIHAANNTLSAKAVLQQAAELASPLELTAMPDVAQEIDEATLMPRPPRPPRPVDLPRPAQQDVGKDEQEEAAPEPQLRVLRPIRADSQELTGCSVFDESNLGDNLNESGFQMEDGCLEDSLGYTMDDGTATSIRAATPAAEAEYPIDVVVRWEVTGSVSGAISADGAGMEEDSKDFEEEEEGVEHEGEEEEGGEEAPDEEQEEEDEELHLSAKFNSDGLLCDAQWVEPQAIKETQQPREGELEQEADGEPVASATLAPVAAALSAPLVTSAAEPRDTISAAERQRAELERRVRSLGTKIERLYRDIVKDMDAPARVVWDGLYGLFQAKMAADLTEEDQREIERFVFEQLSTENQNLIWKVYQVLSLEQERDRNQRLLAER